MTTTTVPVSPADAAAAAKRLTIGATVPATVTRRNQHGATVTVKGNKGFISVKTSPGAAALKMGDEVDVTVEDLPEGKPALLSLVVTRKQICVTPAAPLGGVSSSSPLASLPGIDREQIEALAGKWGATLKDGKPGFTSLPELPSSMRELVLDRLPSPLTELPSLPELPSSLLELRLESEPAANDESAPAQKVKGQPVTGKVVHILTKKDGGQNGQPYAVLVELNELKMTALLLGIDLGRTKLKDLKKGDFVKAVITDVNPNGKVKISVKEWEQLERQQARREQVASVKKGMPFTGKISRIEPYGFFVKVSSDGSSFDGLVHVSQVPGATSAAKHAYLESLTLGDEIKATVLKVDRVSGKVAFTLLPGARKQFFAKAEQHTGQVFEGTIVAIKEYGVLVNLGAVVGLVFVGKIGDSYLAELAASPPQVLKVVVDEVDTERERVHLSLA